MCHDTFTEFYFKQDAFDPGKGTLKSWLALLARRRAIDRLRAAKAGARPSRWTKACPRRPALRRRTGSRCRRRWPGSRRTLR